MTITRDQLLGQVLPALPRRHRAVVAMAAGAGLRWGECVGLRRRMVPLPDFLIEALAEYLAAFPASWMSWCSATSGPSPLLCDLAGVRGGAGERGSGGDGP